MRVFDQLPGPIIICAPAGAPPGPSAVYGLNDIIVACMLCGADVRVYPAWLNHCSPICLLCHLIHAVPECPECSA